jgi:hypothetical protein
MLDPIGVGLRIARSGFKDLGVGYYINLRDRLGGYKGY